LSELPAPVQLAATQLAEAARLYVTTVQQL
jgi:hypothetical protein